LEVAIPAPSPVEEELAALPLEVAIPAPSPVEEELAALPLEVAIPAPSSAAAPVPSFVSVLPPLPSPGLSRRHACEAGGAAGRRMDEDASGGGAITPGPAAVRLAAGDEGEATRGGLTRGDKAGGAVTQNPAEVCASAAFPGGFLSR
jgi:hypothetical protein